MMKNLLLGLATVAMATNAMALPTLKGAMPAEGMKQATVQINGPQKAVKHVGVSTNTPAKAPAATKATVYSYDFEGEGLWTIVENNANIYSFPMQEGGLQSLDPVSGNYYLISGYDYTGPRNAWAFSEGVQLTEGVTYYVSVYAFGSGYDGNLDEWKVTVGSHAAELTQRTVIIDKTGANAEALDDWTFCSGEFTPTSTGTYYFGINHCTSATDVNAVAFDLFQVSDQPIIPSATGSMWSTGGYWSIMHLFVDENENAYTPCLYTAADWPVKYSVYGQYYTNVEWMFGEGAAVASSTEESPLVNYEFATDSFNTDVYLILRNEGSEVYATPRNFDVKNAVSSLGYADFIGNFQPEDIPTCYGNSSSDYSALVGLSDLNKEFAEFFEGSDEVTSNIQAVMLMAYAYTTNSSSSEITLSVCKPDANGLPGEVIASTSSTLGDLFADNSSQLLFYFDTPVSVTGDYFIKVTMPDLAPSQNNYIWLYESSPRSNGYNTLYINIEDASVVDNLIPTGWYGCDELYGMSMSAFVSPLLTWETSGVTAHKISNNSIVYANGKEINIVNAAAGSRVMVTDIAGRTVLVSEVGNNVRTTINTNLNRGIYLVTVGNSTTKVAIR